MLSPVARTPRTVIHRCSASTTTPSSRGAWLSGSQWATCWVNRSCTWGGREQLDHPGQLGQAEDPFPGR